MRYQVTTVHSTLIWGAGVRLGVWWIVRMIAYYYECMCEFVITGYSKGYSKD